MRTVGVQTDDFDPGAENEKLTAGHLEAGAVVTFVGLVRADEGLTALSIEHYPGMTEREIQMHVAEAETRWPILGATIIHRVGRLVPGERIVLVAVASAHREAAFRAAEFLMDYLKTTAPFWKKEERGSQTSWVDARRSDTDAARRWQSK